MTTQQLALAKNFAGPRSYTVPGDPRTTPAHLRGMRLTVLRPAHADGYDGTTGGISAHFGRFVLVGILDSLERSDVVAPMPDEAQVFSAGPAVPAVALEVRHIGEPIVTLIPVTYDPVTDRYVRAQYTMAGGNYASFTDSRMSELLRSVLGHSFYGALPIHDRVE